MRDGRYDEHVEPEDAQCRHLTQHLIENVDYYAQRKVLNYEHPGELLELAKRLQAAQNDLAAAEVAKLLRLCLCLGMCEGGLGLPPCSQGQAAFACFGIVA